MKNYFSQIVNRKMLMTLAHELHGEKGNVQGTVYGITKMIQLQDKLNISTLSTKLNRIHR